MREVKLFRASEVTIAGLWSGWSLDLGLWPTGNTKAKDLLLVPALSTVMGS